MLFQSPDALRIVPQFELCRRGIHLAHIPAKSASRCTSKRSTSVASRPPGAPCQPAESSRYSVAVKVHAGRPWIESATLESPAPQVAGALRRE